MEDDTLWVFGYGSLVFRPAFPHLERRPASIRGWTRRFWQGSPDHRGTPDRPGRVATVVPDPHAEVWGIAYRVAPADAARVLARLDHREQVGYTQHALQLRLPDRVVQGRTYVAGPDNPAFLGPAPLEAMARQILSCAGPSGTNVAYVLRLEEALRELGAPADPTLELAQYIRVTLDDALR